MRSSLRAKFAQAAIAVVGLAGFSTVAHAGLVVDLVPTGGTGGTQVNGSSVKVGAAGDVIHFNVVATVSGTDGTSNESMQTAFGSAVSTLTGGGSAIGNFSAAVPLSPYNGTNSAGGTVQDLNGQAGLDVGSNNAASSADWVAFRSNSPTAGTGASDTSTFVLGTIDWTVSSVPSTGSTQLVWQPRAGGTTAAGGVWVQDGATANNTTGTLPGHGQSYTAGPGVTVTATPEPGSLALLGLGGLGLLLRRRRAM